VIGCQKEKADETGGTPAKKVEPKPEPKKQGLEAGNPELAKAIKDVIDKCEVSDFGWARNCKENADKELEKQQKVVGVKEALSTFCYALSDKNHLVKALAANQINRLAFSKRMKENADEKVLACLMDVLATTKVERQARPVVRAATYMATALKKETEIIKYLESTTMKQVKAAGYGSLWANGRMQVFETLAKVIKDEGDPMIRVSAINGFALGGRLEKDEAAKICELVSPLMSNEELRVASAAANRVANSCPDMKDKVLDAADELIKAGKFNTSYVSAVRNVDGFFNNKASPAQKKRAVALLVKVLKDNKFNDITRSSALRKIAWLDKKEGAKLAKKMAKSDSNFIRRAAEWVLKTKAK
jgi:HEAT repeat protein